MKYLITFLFSFYAAAFSANIEVKSKDIETPCSSRDLKDYKGSLVTHLKLINRSLNTEDLGEIIITNCSVTSESRQRFILSKKARVKLELEYLGDIKDCNNSKYTKNFRGRYGSSVTLNLIDEDLANLKDLGINITDQYLAGLGYSEVTYFVKGCAISEYESKL